MAKALRRIDIAPLPATKLNRRSQHEKILSASVLVCVLLILAACESEPTHAGLNFGRSSDAERKRAAGGKFSCGEWAL